MKKWCCLLAIKYEYALLFLFLTLKDMNQSSMDQQIIKSVRKKLLLKYYNILIGLDLVFHFIRNNV